MNHPFGRFAALGALGGLVLLGYHYTSGAAPRVASRANEDPAAPGVAEMLRQMATLGGGYRLSALKNLSFGDDHIDQHYVDPERIDYAEMYRALGIPELGAILSCNRDAALIEGFNPDVAFTRTQTIMGGASHCNFVYTLTRAPRSTP